jgi:chromosome partitioning protein
MKKIVVVNNKGGIGKTTSVQNISACLALKGKRTLMLDLDPQTNLSESFGQFNQQPNIYHSFSKGEPLNIISIKENLSLVPSSIDFAGIELEIANRIRRENILAKLLAPLEDQFDYCVMDCPPSLGNITLNALSAGDYVIIPMEAEYLAYRGLDTIKNLIADVKREINSNLNICGLFFTKLKPTLSLTKAIKDEVSKTFGESLLESSIRVNIALAESQSNGQDIFAYDSTSNGAKDYKKLVEEILKRLN